MEVCCCAQLARKHILANNFQVVGALVCATSLGGSALLRITSMKAGIEIIAVSSMEMPHGSVYSSMGMA